MNKTKELAGYLVLLTPPGTQEKIPFYLGENIIGRSDSKADVVVRDFSISQKHARLFVTPQAMTLTDIGSKNGITINSEGNQLEKFKEVTIDESMLIILAEVKCKFVRETPKQQPNTKAAVEVKGAKDRKSTDIRNFLLQDQQEGKKQSNLQNNKKQASKVAVVKDQFDIDEGFSKVVTKQQKYKSVNISKKTVQTLVVQKVEKREQKQNKAKNQKALAIQKNDKQANKKQAKNTIKSTIQNKQEKSLSKEPKKVEKQEEANQQKLAQKQVKFNKDQKLQNKKELSIDKQEKDDQKKIKRKKQPKTKELSKDKQQDKKSESAAKALKNKPVADKSKSVAAQSREKSQNKSDATDIQTLLGASTKRRIQNRKRLPTEAALKEAGVLPQRRSYLHKKILISGFSPPLTKKYFQVMQSLDDQFDYLVMREYKRTVKALYCICKGIPIVKYDWIRQSEMFNRTLNYQNYYFKQHPHLYESIDAAKDGNRVLSGYVFYLGSDSFHLKIEDIQILIVAAGGELMKKVGKLTEKERKNPHIIAVIRNLQENNKDDFTTELNKVKKFGFQKVYTIQMILDSIQKQQIDWQKNKATI